jgi:hypothetical protein
MQPDYSPIIDSVWRQFALVLPYVIFAVVFAVAFKFLERRFGWRRRNRRSGRWGNSPRSKVIPFQPKQDWVPGKVPDAADQLRTVMRAEFKAQPLLNKSEARLFRVIDKMVLEAQPDWQVMAQVSLGEILRCQDAAAYSCINSKRVDLLIVDENCQPLHAIEYQGGGHFKGEHATAARDAVKKEALRRAGIGYVEVLAGDTPAELRRVVDRLIRTATVRP